MTTVHCPSCKQPMDVGDNEPDTEWECPNCGAAFLMRKASTGDPEFTVTAPATREHAPKGSITAQPPKPRRPVGPRSGAVTALGVVNLLSFVLSIIRGTFLLFGAGLVESGLLAAFAVLSLMMGVLMGIAGVGILVRRPWGRILTLLLGGLAALTAVTSLGNRDLVGFFFHAAYAGLVFSVLLNPRFVAEFYPESAEAADRKIAIPPPPLNWLTAALCLGALFLGLLLGWLAFRQTTPSSDGGHPLVLVVAADAKSHGAAAAVAEELVRMQNLRVIDPALVPRNQMESGADIQKQARELNAFLLVIVTDDGVLVHGRAVVAKTGVLVGTNRWQKGQMFVAQQLVDQALHKAAQ